MLKRIICFFRGHQYERHYLEPKKNPKKHMCMRCWKIKQLK